jgi:tetratricopeptide (TPR) repeat protein
VAFAALAAYYNSFQGATLLDDKHVFVRNERVQRPWQGWGTFNSVSALVYLSFAVNYAHHGTDVWGYHAVNLAVHVLAALTLFGIARRTFLSERLGGRFARRATVLGFAVALLWALHPIQTQSVTYICQRLESLMGLMYLLTLYCVIRGARAKHASALWYAAAAIACLLGMFCKGVMMTAPVIVLLYDRTFLAGSFRQAFRKRRLLYLLLAATWPFLLLNLWHRFVTEGMGTEVNFVHASVTPWTYAATQFGVILHYLRLSFWPSGLCLDYAWRPATSAIEIVPPAIVILGLLGVTLWGLWRNRTWAFPGAWFFLILGPTSSFLTINELAFEHRMYLSLAGVAAFMVAAAYHLGTSILIRVRGTRALLPLSSVLLVAIASVLGFLTHKRNKLYQSEFAMWQDVIARRPGNPRPYYNLGVAYGRLREDAQAMTHYTTAIQLAGDYVAAYNNRGVIYGHFGQWGRAIEDYSQAIELVPKFAPPYYNRANAYLELGDYDRAVSDFTRAIERKHDFVRAYNDRGVAYQRLGRYDLAIRDYTMAILLKPENARSYANRAAVYGKTKQYRLALRDCREALQRDPNSADAYSARAAVNRSLKRYHAAVADYTRAIQLRPDDPDAYGNRAICYLRLGDHGMARADLAKCRQLGGTPSAELVRFLEGAATKPQ